MFNEDYDMSDELEIVETEEEQEEEDDSSISVESEGMEDLKDMSEVFSLLKDDDNGKFDIRVSMSDIGFEVEPFAGRKDDFDRFYLTLPQELSSECDLSRVEFDSKGEALRQFFKLAGAPSDFTWMVNKSNSWLVDRVIDTMRSDVNNQMVLLRMRKPNTGPGSKKDNPNPYVRAVLKQTYSILDNTTLMKLLESHLEFANLKVQDIKISEHHFHCRLVNPESTVDIDGEGDEMASGMLITNSETGKGPFTMDYMLFRVLCSNGMITLEDGKPLLTQNHTNINLSDLSGDINEAMDAYRENVMAKLDRISRLRHKPVEKPFKLAFEVMRNFSFKATWRELVKQVMLEYEKNEPWFNTEYCIVNAITQASQFLGNPSEREALDRKAGQVMDYLSREY